MGVPQQSNGEASASAETVAPANKNLLYMGRLDHPRVGRPLNIFTAPEDLGVMTINQGMTKIGTLKNFHGFDGLNLGRGYGYERKVFDAWKDGSGLNKWVMMPLVVLNGSNYPGEPKMFNGNLFDNQDKGDLKGTLTVIRGAEWYGSCTEGRDDPDGVWGVRLSDGFDGWDYRDSHRFRVRPCLAQGLTL